MKRIGFAMAGVYCALLASLPAMLLADITTNNVRVGVDIATGFGGDVHNDQDFVSSGPYARGSLSASLAGALPENVEVTGVAVKDGVIVFSTDCSFVSDSTTYNDEDMVAYNPTSGVFSMYLDGSSIGLPSGTDINALCFQPGGSNLYFSIDVSANLPGAGAVTDEDVIGYNWSTLSLAYDGDATLGIPSPADLDALYATTNALYFSLDITATIDTQTGSDEDVWCYDLTNGVTLVPMDMVGDNADVGALDFPLDSDGDGLSDYEEQTGLDDPATTHIPSGAPLDPNGHTSDPNDPDSDGDGMTDGQEAAAGTDSGDPGEVLAITVIDEQAGTNVVLTWQSATGKTYAVLYSTDLLSDDITNVWAASVAAAAGTNRTSYVVTNAPPSGRFYRIKLNIP